MVNSNQQMIFETTFIACGPAWTGKLREEIRQEGGTFLFSEKDFSSGFIYQLRICRYPSVDEQLGHQLQGICNGMLRKCHLETCCRNNTIQPPDAVASAMSEKQPYVQGKQDELGLIMQRMRKLQYLVVFCRKLKTWDTLQ